MCVGYETQARTKLMLLSETNPFTPASQTLTQLRIIHPDTGAITALNIP